MLISFKPLARYTPTRTVPSAASKPAASGRSKSSRSAIATSARGGAARTRRPASGSQAVRRTRELYASTGSERTVRRPLAWRKGPQRRRTIEETCRRWWAQMSDGGGSLQATAERCAVLARRGAQAMVGTWKMRVEDEKWACRRRDNWQAASAPAAGSRLDVHHRHDRGRAMPVQQTVRSWSNAIQLSAPCSTARSHTTWARCPLAAMLGRSVLC